MANVSTMKAKTSAELLRYEVTFHKWMTAGETITDHEVVLLSGVADISLVTVHEKSVSFWVGGGTSRNLIRIEARVRLSTGERPAEIVAIPVI